MSKTLYLVKRLVEGKDIQISAHGYDELAADGILIHDDVEGLANGLVVEDYPDYHKGPCVLVLQYDEDGRPIHVLWGIPKDAASPAVVITVLTAPILTSGRMTSLGESNDEEASFEIGT